MNFILFIPDEMRAESLGCYGHPTAITPHIDAFAAEGVRFDQCHVQHPVCTPSRCSFFTGWYPHVRGHRSLYHLLQRDEPNLLRSLREGGYEVVYGGKNDTFTSEARALSLDRINLGSPPSGAIPELVNPYECNDPRAQAFLLESTIPDVNAMKEGHIMRGAIEYLQSKPEKPFAMVLSLGAPHPPYAPPVSWRGRIDPASLPELRPPDLDGKPDFHRHIRNYRRLDELGDGDFREINARYLESIGAVDELFGQLMSALDETRLGEETAVLFFSDHGDWGGDYGLVEKWPSALDDTITRVPLIIRMPGGKAGHEVKEITELFDISTTVAELAGARWSHTQFGKDLGPQLRGASGDPDRCAFAEGGYDLHETSCFEGDPDSDPIFADPTNVYYPKGLQQQEIPESVCRATMVRSATHKLIFRRAGICELYDLEEDPRELNNRYADPAMSSVRNDLERRLLNWFQETSDAVPNVWDERSF